ncbi:MAG: discoidin domain-containing protein [Bacillota bacterium]|jgi:hypothetical protein|nr:discoidin domain-containing protein [Bacillota bacterium]HOA90646.1 discoidin domain-containing protein [Bacillota bacterium]HOP54126.1 discoidin domain-containing protein [Bacillota bacterium]HPQ10406.1 discoidin domain-containing protein [Bacillota bacterium]HPZ72388.1 discoidin domain-containing protein [Bacillota bacterium]
MKKALMLLVLVGLLSVGILAAENVNLLSYVESDSNFSGYRPDVTNDGERNEGSEVNRWAEVAWASQESPGEHWLEYELPGRINITSIFIWWARDTGVFYYSRDFYIEVDGKVVFDSTLPMDKNNLVKEVRNIEGDAAGIQVTEIYFKEPVKGTYVRVVQHPGGGHPNRPNLMWVAEVEIYE